MFQLNQIKLNKNSIAVGVAILAILVTGVLIFANTSYGNALSFLKLKPQMSAQEVAQKSVDYLNNTVLQGQTATLGEVSEESEVVKFQVKIDTNTYDSYVTKDGKLFFPEAFRVGEKPAVQ